MEVIYKSVKDEIDDAIKDAIKKHRTIKEIVLSNFEFIEFYDEVFAVKVTHYPQKIHYCNIIIERGSN